MVGPVQLPSEILIDCWGFCRAIARAIRPAAESGLEGIDCLVGKVITVENRTFVSPTAEQWAVEMPAQLVLSHEGMTLRHLLPDASTVVKSAAVELPLEEPPKVIVNEFLLHFPLSVNDRAELEKILPGLPPLRYPISDEEALSFMEAYYKLSRRPEWAPILVTPGEVERWKAEQQKTFKLHLKKLQDDLSTGLLLAVDDWNVPAEHLMAGIRIPREYAIEYLKRCCIPYGGADAQNCSVAEPIIARGTNADTRVTAESIDGPTFESSPLTNNTPNSANAPTAPQHVDQSGSIKSENEKSLPGLPTPDIAAAFDGLSRWDRSDWARYLTEARWTADAMVVPGRRGKGGAARWNPALLAALAQEIRGIPDYEFTHVFRNNERLRPWAKEWDDHLYLKRYFDEK